MRPAAPAPAPPARVALNLSLAPDQVTRLKALALLRHCTASELVAEWIARESRGLVFCLRGPASSPDPPGAPAAPPEGRAAEEPGGGS